MDIDYGALFGIDEGGKEQEIADPATDETTQAPAQKSRKPPTLPKKRSRTQAPKNRRELRRTAKIIVRRASRPRSRTQRLQRHAARRRRSGMPPWRRRAQTHRKKRGAPSTRRSETADW